MARASGYPKMKCHPACFKPRNAVVLPIYPHGSQESHAEDFKRVARPGGRRDVGDSQGVGYQVLPASVLAYQQHSHS